MTTLANTANLQTQMRETAETKSFVQIGGVFNILSILCFIGTSVLIGNRVAYAWLGFSATVLFVPASWGMYQFLRQRENQRSLQLGLIANFTGAVFLIGLYLMAHISAVTDGSELWIQATEAATPATQPLLDMIAAALNVAAWMFVLFGSVLTYAVGPFLFAWGSLRTAVIPKWLAWMGIVGGFYSFLWLGWGWAIQPEQILLFLPGVLLVYLWALIMGIYMALPRQRASS